MRRPLAAAALAGILLFGGVAHADERPVEELFAATATARDARYVVGREALLARDDGALAMADARADDPDAGVRALARLLRLHRDRPADVAAWSKALAAPQLRVERDDATGRARGRWETRNPAGALIRAEDVVFTTDAIPLVIDALRGGEHGGTHWQRVNAVAVAGALRAAETVPWIVPLLQVPYMPGEFCEAALIAIGAPAVASVRPLLDDVPAGDRRRLPVTRTVRILAQAGDRESIPRIRELLERGRDRDVLAECAEALLTLDPDGGAAAAVGRIAGFDPVEQHRGGGNWDYPDVREAALRFGDRALAAARKHRETATDSLSRARLDGFVWELEHPDAAAAAYAPIGRANIPWRSEPQPSELPREGRRFFWVNFQYGELAAADDPPLPLVLERAAAFWDERDVVAAATSATPAGIAVARAVLLASPGRRAPALMALAAADPEAALDVLDVYTGPEPPDDLAECLAASLLLLDRPRVRPILERTADRGKTPSGGREAHERARPIAAAALAVVRGERTLADLLTMDDATVRLAAARALARRGDPSGVGVLAAAAVVASGPAYESLRDDLVRAGRAPEATPGDDVASRVLRDAIAARIAAPAAARAVDMARIRHRPQVMTVVGAQFHHFVQSGEALADELEAPARAVLEEAALFLRDRVAIHAVAALGDERSIPVLVQCARFRHADAAAGLRRMGDKGLAAAAAVPPPDPERAAYGDRASRHVGAAEALDETPAGIDKAIEGLAEPVPSSLRDRDDWRERMHAYLRVAAKSADSRKVEPVLRVLAAARRDEDLLVRDALAALANAPDPRVVDACVERLVVGVGDRNFGAEDVLRTQLGDRLWTFLRERVETATGRTRSGIVHAMWSIVLDASRPAADRDAVAALLRKRLTDPDARLASAAAYDLVRLHTKRPPAPGDDRDVAALLEYVRTHGDLGIEAEDIARLGPTGAGEAFRASYAIANSGRALGALVHLAFEPAAPDVEAAMTRKLGEKPFDRDGWVPGEVRALAHLGADGRRRARAFVAGAAPLRVRLVAAWGLAEVHDPDAFDVLLALDDAVEATGDGEQRVKLRRGLIGTLGLLDADRAHAEFVRRSLATRDPDSALAWADGVLDLRRRRPDLAPDAAPPK